MYGIYKGFESFLRYLLEVLYVRLCEEALQM
jgi:hypothetical protein